MGLAERAALAQPAPQHAVTGRTVIVVPESRARNAQLRPIIEAFGYRVVMETPISGVMAVAVPPGTEEIAAALMRQWPGVRRTGRDLIGRGGTVCDAAPPVMSEPFDMPEPTPGNDPDFEDQWYLENIGQVIVNGSCPTTDPLNDDPGVPGVDINIRKAWAITQGCEDIVVAVIDTGVQYENPAFDPARFFFPDLAATCPNGTLLDPYTCCWEETVPPYTPGQCAFGYAIDMGGHGTPVASVVGARGNNFSGVAGCVEMAGVDLKCRILAARTSIVNAFGGWPVYNHFSEYATLYVLEEIASNPVYADVRVINMSYSFDCDMYSSPIYDELQDACEVLKSVDIVVVVLAGNSEGYANRCPTRWDSVIAVSGIDNIGDRWQQEIPGSCLGISAAGESVDFCAPARAIVSAPCNPSFGTPGSTPPPSPCNAPIVLAGSGTSGATPQVAAIVSLLFARADELGVTLTWQDVYDLLFFGSRRLAHWPGSGRDDVYGWGLVDAYESLVALELLHYRFAHPHNRADLTDHNTPGTWRFGVADGVIDCDDKAYFMDYAYPNLIVEKADFTTTGALQGQPGYGVPDGVVNPDDRDYFLDVLFPAAYAGTCN
ncbi:MAG: S8 family serine peptidase [Phycisphaerales bacterium]|nr:S8 family serine peptidase [Phycisphaerales bacterium]